MCTCAVDAQHLTLAQQIALFGAAGPPPPHAAAPSPSLPPRAAAAAAAAPRAVPRLRALVGSHGANLAPALWAGRPCALIEVVPPPPRPAFDNYSRRMLRLSNEANCHRRDICFLANLFGIGDLKAKTAW